jgi:hypothetical protein
MEQSQFSPAELIYLFLDGEHTCADRSVLFTALSNSTELQSEFEDALKIRSAVSAEMQTLSPPANVTAELMGKAGFAMGASSTVSSAINSGVTFPTWLSLIASKWYLSAMAFAVPALTAIGGFILGSYSESMNGETNGYVATQYQRPTLQLAVSSNYSNLELPAKYSKSYSSLDYGQQIASAKPILSPTALISESSNETSQAVGEVDKNVNITNVPSRNSFNSSISSSNENGISSKEFTPIAFSQTRESFTVPLVTMGLNNSVEQNKPYTFALTLRGLSNINMTQQSLISPERPQLLNNFAIGLAYPLNENFSLTAETGREIFPLFIEANDGSLNLRQNQWWGSVGVMYMSDAIEPLYNIRPTGSLSVGGSASGPLFRGLLGISWLPSSSVVLTGGLEAMGQSYKYNGSTSVATKVGFTYGISIRF